MASIRLMGALPQLPPTVNPYAFLEDGMQSVFFPSVPSSDPVFAVLIAFAVVYVVIFCLAVSIVVIPFTRNQKFQQKYLWLWKKEHVAQDNKIYSYYIPNPGMAVAISQIFASILAEIFIVLSYMNFESSNFSQRSYVSMWLVVSYVPGFFGFWFSGWSALYLYILSKKGQRSGGSKQTSLPHPWLLNTLCIGVPSIVLIVATGYGIASLFFYRSEELAFGTLISSLQAMAERWTPPTPPTNHFIDYNALLGVFVPFHQTSQTFLWHFKGACQAWCFFVGIAVIFYTITVVLLLRLMRQTVTIARGAASALTSDFEAEKGHSEATFLNEDREMIRNSQHAKKMSRKYLFLVARCSLVTLLLMWYVVTGLLLTIKAEEILTTPSWRVTSAWVIGFSSAFLSLSLLIQSGEMLLSREGSKAKLKISNPILQVPVFCPPSAPSSSAASLSVSSPHVRFQSLESARKNSVIYITLGPATLSPLPSPRLELQPDIPPLRSTSLPSDQPA